MTIIELVVIIINCVVGLLFAKYAAAHWGFIFGIIAFPFGFGFGFLIFTSLHFLGRVYYTFRPVGPPCNNNKCKWDDFKVVEVKGEIVYFKCLCGDVYFKKDGTFYRQLEDGSSVPYMKRNYSGKWINITGEIE